MTLPHLILIGLEIYFIIFMVHVMVSSLKEIFGKD